MWKKAVVTATVAALLAIGSAAVIAQTDVVAEQPQTELGFQAHNGWGPGDGTGDGIPDLDCDGYGPGDCTGDGIPDYLAHGGWGPGDGTGDGIPDLDCDGWGAPATVSPTT